MTGSIFPSELSQRIAINHTQFGPRYNWSTFEQSLLHGSFFIGYGLSTFPSGLLIDRYGLAKQNITWTCVLSTVLTALCPLAARSFATMFILRTILGLVSVKFAIRLPKIWNYFRAHLIIGIIIGGRTKTDRQLGTAQRERKVYEHNVWRRHWQCALLDIVWLPD